MNSLIEFLIGKSVEVIDRSMPERKFICSVCEREFTGEGFKSDILPKTECCSVEERDEAELRAEEARHHD